MLQRSLRKMREYGCTTFSGIPSIAYRGFQDQQPVLDFAAADAQMKMAKELGFLAVVSYGGGVSGINAYYQDTQAMNAAGFQDYAEFVKAVYTAIQKHAEQQGWIPVYYNLGDEPLGDDLTRSAENAEAYRKAFPQGPPFFTAASSFSGSDQSDPHFRLSKALHVVDWNGHDEDGGESAAQGGQRLGLLQWWQPMDVWRLHVQGSQAVSHAVSRLLALERRRRRSVLRARLPGRRLRLVQLVTRRPVIAVDSFRTDT